MKSIQIKSNSENDGHILDLQDSILVQEFMVLNMFSKGAMNVTSSSGKREHLVQNVIEKKNEDCPRNADGHKLKNWIK